VRATAETFRSDGKTNLEAVIGELAIGEALVSFLDEKGTPAPARRTMIAPPRARIGPISPDERRAVMSASIVSGVYEQKVDRESAYERIRARATQSTPPPPPAGAAPSEAAPQNSASSIFKQVLSGSGTSPGGRGRQTPLEAFVVSTARSLGSQLGRQIMRGVLGSIMGKGR
jgi:hypothetical protein